MILRIKRLKKLVRTGFQIKFCFAQKFGKWAQNGLKMMCFFAYFEILSLAFR